MLHPSCLPCQSCNSLLAFLCEVVRINCYKAGHLKSKKNHTTPLVPTLVHARRCTFSWETPKRFFSIIKGCSSAGGIPCHSSHFQLFITLFAGHCTHCCLGIPWTPPGHPGTPLISSHESPGKCRWACVNPPENVAALVRISCNVS